MNSALRRNNPLNLCRRREFIRAMAGQMMINGQTLIAQVLIYRLIGGILWKNRS